MTKGALLAPALILLANLLWPFSVRAQEIPQFPTCVNPIGIKIVDVGTGIHGIVGDMNTYSGSDKVYALPDGNFLQCFCSVDNKGIQTNWWRISSISEAHLNVLKADNWIYVPSGSPWGLGETEYMAKNNGYQCPGGAGNGGSSSGGSGLAGQVLGLAFTGNISYVYAFLGTGMLLATLGFILSRNK